MDTDRTEELQAQIDRFERIRASVGEAAFPDEIVSEWSHLGLSEEFTATLVDDPCIEATADVDPTGKICSIRLVISERGCKIQEVDVEPGSALWRAMEVWREDLRRTWSED